MDAIIFGAAGQDGFYLTQLLKQQNINVIGVSRSSAIIQGTVTDEKLVVALIQKYKPNYIFHLAANSTTRHDALFENHETISTGTLYILEAVKKFSPGSKVFISGSGLQFVNQDKPIKETDAFEARDAYSVSRIQSVYAARYFRTFDLTVYIGYFFNHDSPMRTERHMSKKISEAVKRIGQGSKEILEIGDISVTKEWAYAADIVNGIWTLVNQHNVWEANIASGLGYSIEDWLRECFSLINKDWRDFVRIREGFVSEYKQLVSNPSLIFSLGWQPEVSFAELAKMMIQ